MSSPVRFSLTYDQVAALESVEDSIVTAGPRCMTALHMKGIVKDWRDGTLTPFGRKAVALVNALPPLKKRTL